jgi:hypothetical protein
MILAFMMELLTLAPQYSTFGTQTFSKFSSQGEVPCKLSLINKRGSDCQMSNISKFYNRISISLPFFSTILYISNWLLIVVGTISIVYAAFFKDEDILDGIDEKDDDEERNFLTQDRYL